ncbi:MAG: hypothetical protein ACKO7U_10530, partial [Actinomycetota bacterium]
LTTDEVLELPLPAGAGNLAWAPGGAHVSFTQSVAIDPPVTAAHPDLPLSELAERGGCPRPTLAARLRRMTALADEDGGPAESGSASA